MCLTVQFFQALAHLKLFKELINAVMMFQKLENIVAFDINELAPMLDSSGASTACACKVLREMLLVTSK